MAEEFLFLREAQLEMFPKIEGTNSPINEVTKRIFKGRIQFNVDLSTESKSNKAEISLYNISEETRSFLEDDNILVRLKAGYQDNIGEIFFGDIIENGVKTDRNDADIITKLECGDAEKIINRVHIDIGLGPGATNEQLFLLASKQLQLTLGVKKGIKKVTYFNGFTFSGTVKTLLDQLTKQIDLEWNVQAGVLRILPRNETDGQDAVLVTKETGLIGFPTKTKKRVEFRSLLNNKIAIGGAVKLISQQITGLTTAKSQSVINAGVVLKVEKATFEGDSSEGAWEVRVEGSIPGLLNG
jgi:hypothetical protein